MSEEIQFDNATEVVESYVLEEGVLRQDEECLETEVDISEPDNDRFFQESSFGRDFEYPEGQIAYEFGEKPGKILLTEMEEGVRLSYDRIGSLTAEEIDSPRKSIKNISPDQSYVITDQNDLENAISDVVWRDDNILTDGSEITPEDYTL